MTQRDSMTVRAQRQRACVFIFFFLLAKLLIYSFSLFSPYGSYLFSGVWKPRL